MKIIIMGAGEVGFHIASHLAHENKDVVVIDTNSEAVRRVSENVDVNVIHASGASPVILEEAGIREAEIFLAVTNSDEANLVACLMADTLAPSTLKLARIRGADFDAYHEKFRDHAPHIDTVINPEIEVVKTIEQLMNVPGAVDVGEFAEGRVKFIGVHLEPGTPIEGVQLMDLGDLLEGPRPLIVAIVRNEQLIIPRGKDRLQSGDLIYFISAADRYLETLAIFGKRAEPIKRVMIVGGGRIGLRLAKVLETKSIATKLIENSSARCQALAERLNRTIVLQGDGRDQALLREENVQEIDVVVSLTDDEETNILTSLLAKQMGARKTITKISKFSYFSLMGSIGLDLVVSTRLSAINTILQHIRRGKVLSAISIKGEQAEALEAEALETSDIVGRPLRKMGFPKGAILAAIIRNEAVIIPNGESVVTPGDRVVIFAQRQAIPKVEKLLAVKLEYS